MKPPLVSSANPLLDINSNTMKTPIVSSVPSLIDIDPMAPFEFHFPADEPWWDEYDFASDTSDYFSCDSLSFCSSECEFDPGEDLNLSFSSEFYHICDTAPAHPEALPIKEVCRRSPREEEETNDVDDEKEKSSLITNLLSTISKIAPKLLYNRRKHSTKRRKNRRKRKRTSAASIEPELRSLWYNSSVGDLFAHSAVSVRAPPSSLPKINLNNVNRTMLRRLPEVVEVAILSCDENPEFYTKIIGNAVTRTTSIPFTGFDRPGGSCFGKLPAILTDLGPVPPPTDDYYGYIYADGGWRVKAECPRVPDLGGRQGGGCDGGGRVGGAERRGGKKKFM